MPDIVSYTPAWLSNPSLGHEIFTPARPKHVDGRAPSTSISGGSSKYNVNPGPKRTIARRGAEVFVAVGKEIRWADLVYVKELYEVKLDRKARGKRAEDFSDDGSSNDDAAEGYRIIKTTVADDIKQLVISPHGDYLAILTTHTVHISVLPDSSHLTGPDRSPLRLKTYTLGPTTHVTSQSAVKSALWHPLGVNGTCLVTVTEEAVVRIWELSTTDRWSFDRPALAIDLKKLADGTSLDQDFSASKFGSSKRFSPDSVEMEVASACFGGRGTGGWSPMTLWVAMREGDVYALCPLLPEKWAPPPTLIPSLSVAIVAKVAMMEDDFDYSEDTKRLSQQQLAWMSDLDNQEPVTVEGPVGEEPADVYTRPQKPGRVPKLQGPFILELAADDSDNDLDTLLSDIFVIGAKIDADALMDGEDAELDFDEVDQEGLSIGVICLASSSGRVSICLDVDGVEAQWLPIRKSKQLLFPQQTTPPSLLTYQVLDTLRSKENREDNWPMFSEDVASRYSFFVTNWSNVTFISLSAWVFRLESDLQNGPAAGIDFRLDLLAKGENFIRDRLISNNSQGDESLPALAACTSIRDPDLGYFLLTNSSHGPISLTLATPEDSFNMRRLITDSPSNEDSESPDQPLLLCPPRPVYEPPAAFTAPSNLPEWHDNLRQSKNKRLLHEPIRLSPATLTIFADAHKIMSEETHRINGAAAELFRRCEKLQVDLKEQIAKANEVANRIEQVIGDDNDVDDSYVGANQSIEDRIENAKDRQRELAERVENIKKKVGRSVVRELSDREKIWFEEISTLNKNILGAEEGKDSGLTGGRKMEFWRRFEEVKSLKEGIVEEVAKISEKEGSRAAEVTRDEGVPTDIRRGKVAQVMQLIERETALVEGVKGRLERLSLV
ncbi:hypothetical protein VE04_00449 [Pseudogymnoascus sp. 24MN13]|nr:hypothetical protein VE04_00449 [Pseudogymnoascus sp. 24MN13]